MGLPGLGKLEEELHELTDEMQADMRAIRSAVERLVEIEEERLAFERKARRSGQRERLCR